MESQAAGIQFHDPASERNLAGHTVGEDEVDGDHDVRMTAEDADQQYARRLQAKMDAARYATAQRGYDLQKIQQTSQCPVVFCIL